jgi:hypothetical protein
MGLESKVDHVAFEVVDLDAVEMGQQVMMAKRYRHAWGVGRHLLGSQIFDYWRDPWGQKHERYADGDLFDAAQPAGYHLMMGGIIVGTMLTLLFLPALYVAWFRIKEPEPATDNKHENPTALELKADLSADAPFQPEMENA